MSVLESSLRTSAEDAGILDTATSPSRRTSGGSCESEDKSWSKREAVELLKLFFMSAFFVLPKAGFENTLIAAEACKKVILQNLIERVLVGVDLNIFKAGGLWGKVLNTSIKARQDAAWKAGSCPVQAEGGDGSPDQAVLMPGIHGLLVPPPPRPVAGQRSGTLEAHCKATDKCKKKKSSEALTAASTYDPQGKPKKAGNDWFELEGSEYRRGVKLNPALLLKTSGRTTIFWPFLDFADPRCDAKTRELAEKLGVTQTRQWTFQLSDLEVESAAWSKPVAKVPSQVGDATLSARAAMLLTEGTKLPRFNLEPQPTCIVDDDNTEWFSVYLSKPGGFQSVTDVRFIIKTHPDAELVIQPAKGVTGPEYICNETLGSTPQKVHIKRKFSQLKGASQPHDGWADIAVPLPIFHLDLKRREKKLLMNGMILLIVQKRVPVLEDEVFEI